MSSMLLVLIVAALGMFLAQVAIFRQLPGGLRALLACIPLLGFLINFLLSALILLFTGAGNTVGLANVIASVVFGFYLLAYAAARKADVSVAWKGKYFLRFPILQISHQEPIGALGSVL